MVTNTLDRIFDGVKDLIPHIEEAALKYMFRQYIMAGRVTTFTDMTGFNNRKISQYVVPARAVDLSEDTDIPTTELLRARLNSIAPIEIGHRYPITDRRIQTDLEDIVVDTIEALGTALGSRVEADLYSSALSTFHGGTLGSSSTDFSMSLVQQAAMLNRQRTARTDPLSIVAHPFQTQNIISDLLTFSDAEVGQSAVENFRNPLLLDFNLRGIGNIAIGDMLPRNVVFKCHVDGTGGTFRLQVGDGYVVGVNVTATITVSTTAATMIANIDAALDALTFTGNGTWTTTGSNINDMTITPPSTLFLDDDAQLRVAVKYDEDATLSGVMKSGALLRKSSYDLVTTLGGLLLDGEGTSMGVQLDERVGSTAKALAFYPKALVLDIREAPRSFAELVKQGRTIDYSMYMKYGSGGWRQDLGMFILTKAEAPNAVA